MTRVGWAGRKLKYRPQTVRRQHLSPNFWLTIPFSHISIPTLHSIHPLPKMYARAQIIRCAAREASSRPLPPSFASPSVLRSSRATRVSAFHSSSSRRDDIPRSPYQIFVETLKEELKKNQDLQDNVKQLQGDVDKLQDSESMKRAKEMYERARVSLYDGSSTTQPEIIMKLISYLSR